MMNFILELAVAIYITSTIFMLHHYFGVKAMFARKGRRFYMPFWCFLWMHFMPIIHTVELVKIERRAKEIARQRGL